jgi:uncharacterized protein YhaN
LDPKLYIAGAKGHAGTIARVVLIAFLVGLALVVVGTVFATARAIGLWRLAKRTGRVFGEELAAFDERATRTERHMSEWERSNRDFDLALERLRQSQARLRVLLDSLERAQGRVRWLRVFVPR